MGKGAVASPVLHDSLPKLKKGGAVVVSEISFVDPEAVILNAGFFDEEAGPKEGVPPHPRLPGMDRHGVHGAGARAAEVQVRDAAALAPGDVETPRLDEH